MKWQSRFLISMLILAFMIFAMVVIGGLTRLTGSGLSMVDWKPITGILPPLNAQQWLEVFQLYQKSPEYLNVNMGMSLDEFKSIFWLEYIHRVWGRLIGFALLVPTYYAFAKKQFRPSMIVLWVLGLGQGAMGWYMVKSGLINDPMVSPYRLTAHLCLALVILAVILRVIYWARTDGLPRSASNDQSLRHNAIPPRCHLREGGDPGLQWKYPSQTLNARLRGHDGGERVALFLSEVHSSKSTFFRWRFIRNDGLLVAIFLISLTIIMGGFTAGLHAGLIYNTFPLMGDSYMPAEVFHLHPLWRNIFENPAAVQFIHRNLAIFTVGYVGYISWRAIVSDADAKLKKLYRVLLAMTIVQVLLGISAVLLIVPIWLASIHQAWAVLLFAKCVWIYMVAENIPHAKVSI